MRGNKAECSTGLCGEDKGEGGRELDQAMNGASVGHEVYDQAVVGQMKGGEMSLQITMRM